MFRHIFVLTCFFYFTSSELIESIKVTPSLQSKFISNPNNDILVSFHQGSSGVLKKFQFQKFDSDSEKTMFLFNSLKSNAAQSQKSAIGFLESKKDGIHYKYKSFWITNQMLVKNATENIVNEFSKLIDVMEITEDLKVINGQAEVVSKKRFLTKETVAPQPGVTLIGAPKIWADLGLNGTGIIVGSIDSGVRGTHTALKANFLGNLGWHDAVGESSVPVDEDGHGTHTLGTILGNNGIGVAPGAKWMACRAGNTLSTYIECAQFMSCPSGGVNNDCGPLPRVISNSWGSETPSDIFDEAINAWHALNIIPVFAIGNSGPFCATANSPGDYKVIAVGSVNLNDTQSTFSSVGPGRFEQEFPKPEIMAPGEAIWSSWFTEDDAYSQSQGTSMAAPHVTGAIAILLQNNSSLTYTEIREILFTSANKKVTPIPLICNGVNPLEDSPNYAVGYGRIDIFEALQPEPNSSKIHLSNVSLIFIAGLVMNSLYS